MNPITKEEDFCNCRVELWKLKPQKLQLEHDLSMKPQQREKRLLQISKREEELNDKIELLKKEIPLDRMEELSDLLWRSYM